MRFKVEEAEAGERLDLVLSRRVASARGVVQTAIKEGRVTVDGTQARPSLRLVESQEVVASFDVAPSPGPQPEDIPVDVRYSDDRVLVVSKPAGLVTHPAGGHETGTLVNALLGMGGDLSGAGTERPGIVHRLDKDTSGLLLVARDDAAHAALATALKDRSIGRTYLALVRGAVAEDKGTVDAPIGRHPVNRRRMAVAPGGRSAVTHYEVLGRSESFPVSLLEVTLETGRTHQIRVHLAHLRHPVVGDRTYGGGAELADRLGLSRPFLHACRLRFPHPEDGRQVTVEDPLPRDLARVLKAAELDL